MRNMEMIDPSNSSSCAASGDAGEAEAANTSFRVTLEKL